MQKSKSFLSGFLTAHFFRHSAGIAAFMLFTLSLMSFKYDSGIKRYGDPKKGGTKKDSAATINNFEGLLTGNFTDDEDIDRSVFTLRPEMASFVKAYDKRESEEYGNMKDWAQPYFELYDSILSANGLPVELKYLSVIESGLQNTNITGGSAVGPWQLMPYEAKRFGLKTGKNFDERMSYRKSTEVAAQLLKELHNTFGDWLLVVAAYNCGMGRMKKAIAEAHSDNYWKLQQYLPSETRYHVKKYIATHYFFEGGGGWTTVTAAKAAECRIELAKRNEAKNMAYLSTVSAAQISGKYKSAAIIRSLSIDPELFNKLNPAFDKTVAEGKSYSLKLPQNKMPLFITNRKQILEKSAQMMLSSVASIQGS
ncbi:MAG TPA: lytic transglycosylase domain-containing protein [Chitinophagaceae bacterium]|nr:lytic transglycosylase domain-containing protein [Chitinophagaceae bacterium]